MYLNFNKKDIIHFIGIGGIGMSGIALILKQMGYEVQGSDISKKNKNIDRLKKNKIKVFNCHKASNIKQSKIIVISSAIKKENPELLF
jgi:UDP-N-acetylmuramate--alanine ligase